MRAPLPLEPRADRPHFSPKAIDVWEDCNAGFELTYVTRAARRPPSFAQAFGRAMHATTEGDSRQRIGGDRPFTRDEAKDVFRDTFAFHAGDAIMSPSDVAEFGNEKQARKALMLQGLACARLWVDQVSPAIEPMFAELPFRIPLPGKAYDYIGRLDLITHPGRLISFGDLRAMKPRRSFGEMRVLTDLKFGRGRRRLIPQDSKALTMYYGAHAFLFEGDVPEVLGFLRVNRSPLKPRWKFSYTFRQPADFAALVDYTDAIAASAEGGIFEPTGMRNGHCDPQFCDFFRVCQKRLIFAGDNAEQSTLLLAT